MNFLELSEEILFTNSASAIGVITILERPCERAL